MIFCQHYHHCSFFPTSAKNDTVNVINNLYVEYGIISIMEVILSNLQIPLIFQKCLFICLPFFWAE